MKGCLTKVKAFNATIDIIHIDVSGIVTWLVLVIGCWDLHFCMHTRRCCWIPEKIFLVRLRPGCDTDVLNPTSLRRLIHCYRIGSSTWIDILNRSLRLSHGISELHFCSRGTNTYTRTIILDIIKVNMVLTSRVFVVARFDRYLVISVCLASCFIPADVVLAVLIRPSRDLHSSHTFRIVDIPDDDIKGTCILVVVLD